MFIAVMELQCMGTIRIGCSGWDYRDWMGTLYGGMSLKSSRHTPPYSILLK